MKNINYFSCSSDSFFKKNIFCISHYVFHITSCFSYLLGDMKKYRKKMWYAKYDLFLMFKQIILEKLMFFISHHVFHIFSYFLYLLGDMNNMKKYDKIWKTWCDMKHINDFSCSSDSFLKKSYVSYHIMFFIFFHMFFIFARKYEKYEKIW